MTARLTETDVQAHFDQDGRWPGVYCLRLADPPDDPDAVADAWGQDFDVLPPAGFAERLAAASRLVYVGSHGQSVYRRICQHARGEKSATIMGVWPPVDIVATWREDHPPDHEWGYAVDLSDDQTVVWCDGSLV